MLYLISIIYKQSENQSKVKLSKKNYVMEHFKEYFIKNMIRKRNNLTLKLKSVVYFVANALFQSFMKYTLWCTTCCCSSASPSLSAGSYRSDWGPWTAGRGWTQRECLLFVFFFFLLFCLIYHPHSVWCIHFTEQRLTKKELSRIKNHYFFKGLQCFIFLGCVALAVSWNLNEFKLKC